MNENKSWSPERRDPFLVNNHSRASASHLRNQQLLILVHFNEHNFETFAMDLEKWLVPDATKN